MTRMTELPKNYKICKKCKEAYRVNSNFQKFCLKCTTIKCKNCEKEFRVIGISPQGHCSFSCFKQYQKGRPIKVNKKGQRKAKASIRLRWRGIDRPELIKKISEATSKAMLTPEVQAKIRATRNPLSKDHRQKLSDLHAGKMPKNIGPEGTNHQSVHQWVEIGGQEHYYRSTWEVNIAYYLEWLKERGEIKNWDYEPKRFIFDQIQFGNRTYLPDFFVEENDGSHYWIEVKGYMTQAARTKLKRMQKYYPNELVQVLDSDQYHELKKDLRYLIPGWK